MLFLPLASATVSIATAQARLTRGPYLQLGTPHSMQVRWRTDSAVISEVRYGTNAANLSGLATATLATNRHTVALSNLQSDTTYFYSVGSPGVVLTNGTNFAFRTGPSIGSRTPVRVWILGDSGFTNDSAAAVRNGYLNYPGTRRPDVWLMLGDNAYTGGSDAIYQNAVFDMYPMFLRQTPLWSTIGNQETAGSANPPATIAYFEIFSFPMSGEAGGEPSGSERYYSFDYGNVHFICLDSMSSSRAAGGPMLTWLAADLAGTDQEWTIAFWHHPPYSKGFRDSDANIEQIEMRANAVALLESYGVDLVFTGHCHSYERSHLLDGHYGLSSTFTTNFFKDAGDGRLAGDGAYLKPSLGPAAHEGAVYVVAGSGSSVNGGPFNHPVMYQGRSVLGSVVLDIHANRLEFKFLRETSVIDDYFTLIKGDAVPRVRATIGAGGAVALEWNAVADRTYHVEGTPVLPSDTWTDLSGPLRADDISARWVSAPGLTATTGFLRVRSAED
jgi:hypothetical protein